MQKQSANAIMIGITPAHEEHAALAAHRLRLREGLARDAVAGVLVGERLVVGGAGDVDVPIDAPPLAPAT